jgi:hypothetical protein
VGLTRAAELRPSARATVLWQGVDAVERLEPTRAFLERQEFLLVERRPLSNEPCARGGSCPDKIARLLIVILASCSAYSA